MDSEPLEPLDIDEPATDPWTAPISRRAPSRLGELVGVQGLDFAALIWVLCIVVLTAVEIYQAFDLFGTGVAASSWDKIAALGQTGGPLVAVGCLAGIALAFLSDSAVARFTIFMAGVVGAIGGIALAGFGLVVMMIAWRAGNVAPRDQSELS